MADKQLNHQRTTWLGSQQSITIRDGLIERKKFEKLRLQVNKETKAIKKENKLIEDNEKALGKRCITDIATNVVSLIYGLSNIDDNDNCIWTCISCAKDYNPDKMKDALLWSKCSTCNISGWYCTNKACKNQLMKHFKNCYKKSNKKSIVLCTNT
jgi:hypothetical protein